MSEDERRKQSRSSSCSSEDARRKPREAVNYDKDGRRVVRVEEKKKTSGKDNRGVNRPLRKKNWEDSADESSDDDSRGRYPSVRGSNRFYRR